MRTTTRWDRDRTQRKGYPPRGGSTAIRLAGVALLISLGGCSSPAPTGPTPEPTPTVTVTPVPTPAEAAPPLDNDPPPTTPPQVAGMSPADLAVATMTAFIDHDVDPAGWITGLSPHLSPRAAADWAGTDPAAVPAHQLVGFPDVVEQGDYLATVTQGTDAGTYLLLLGRREDGTWQVELITPPAREPVT